MIMAQGERWRRPTRTTTLTEGIRCGGGVKRGRREIGRVKEKCSVFFLSVEQNYFKILNLMWTKDRILLDVILTVAYPLNSLYTCNESTNQLIKISIYIYYKIYGLIFRS